MMSCRLSLMLVVALISFLTMSAVLTTARSSGQLSSCDQSWFNNSNTKDWTIYPNGYYGQNNTNGRYYAYPLSQRNDIMPWAWWPQTSGYYTFRTSDSATPASDPTFYTPGRWTELHLRVQDIKRKFIGLALYATNLPGTGGVKDKVVGQWSFPDGAPFQRSTCANGGPAVTHIDANLKPLHTRFYFQAPAGTGKVTFKLLIKQGEQNRGNFWYLPTLLTLNEGAAVVAPSLPTGGALTSTGESVLKTDNATQYVVGAAGKACAEVCSSQTPATPYCHFVKTQTIINVYALQQATQGQVMCELPYLQGCMYNGAAFVDAQNNCYFRGDLTSCPRAYLTLNQTATPQPNLCFTRAAPTNRPICACSNERASQPINPFQTSAYKRRLLSYYEQSQADEKFMPANSAGKFGLSSIIVALVALVSSLVSKSHGMRVLLVCMVVLAVAQPTSAHNFIKGLHRAREAAVSVPCQQRIGNQPHVQVIRDQAFEIEWSLGHGDQNVLNVINGKFWFAMVHEDDYMQLAAQNITAILQDYLDSAWAEKQVNASLIQVGWNKVHLHNLGEDATSVSTIKQYFDIWNLSRTAPEYVTRDPVYTKWAHPSQYTTDSANIQSRFLSNGTALDRRASYQSAKYPWLEHVTHFFNHIVEHGTVVNQADIARFSVPKFARPGNHILYFNWNGYKDCVDINVLDGTTPVALRYGHIDNTVITNTVKFDHCEFRYIPGFWTSCRKVDKVSMDASACIKDCQYYGCAAVQVVRVTNPNGTLPAIPNYPLTYFNGTVDPANKCQALGNEDRIAAGCPLKQWNTVNPSCDVAKLGLADDDYMCFGLQPLRDVNLQVEEDFDIAQDTQEPGYYSTCFFLTPDRNFTNITVTPTPPPSFVSGESCVPCAFWNKIVGTKDVTGLNSTQVPLWANGGVAATTACLPCDQVMSTASVATWEAKLNGVDLAQAGRKDAQTLYPITPTSSSSTAVASSSSSSSSSTAVKSSSSTGEVKSSSSTGVVTSASSTGSDASSSSTGTTGPAETQAIQITIRLNTDWNTVDSDAFKTSFQNAVASALKILAERVVLGAKRLVSADSGKRASSLSRALLQQGAVTSAVDVDFLILPSSDGTGPTVASAAQDFNTQVTQPTSVLLTSSIGSMIEKSVAPQQVDVPRCANGLYVSPCPSSNNDNADGGDNGSGSSTSSLSTMALALIIIGAIVALFILAAILFFVVKSCAARSANQKALLTLAADSRETVHRASTA